MKSIFWDDTYIVSMLSQSISEKVMGIRRENKDLFRMALPVEITITGSSGVGVFERDESPEKVFKIVNEIAARFPVIEASFGEVMRFPNTDIFVLTLKDETPFIELHNSLRQSGIRFTENEFPYKPHCTLRGLSPVTEEEANKLLSLTISEPFQLDNLTVLSMKELNGNISIPVHHRSDLVGNQRRY